MRRLLLTLTLAASAAHAATAVRILLGQGDPAGTDWSGAATARGATISAVEPWRFDAADAMLPGNGWKISTHLIRLFGTAFSPANRASVPNGVVLRLDGDTEDAQIDIQTPRGPFTFKLSEIPYGKRKTAFDGKAIAERIPPFWRITSDADQQDYPAAATGANGEVWLAYLQFKHSPNHNEIRNTPNNFDNMTVKPGGDQILLRKYASGAWGEPIAITPPGGDLYRPAIAVDGKGRPWVFWSANDTPQAKIANFELWARVVTGGKPGPATRVSAAAGSDIDPAAATDSSGRVWVAWQGWRNGLARIFAASQNGDKFSAPETVAAGAANEWNPAIAASSDGRVTVAWDSYRHGNYDVFARTASGPGKWGGEIPVAASAFYEAYPSLAYDLAGTLWVAYEEGSERWGKDFGADESSGIALYAGRAIRLRGIAKDGAIVEPASSLDAILPGFPAGGIGQTTQGQAAEWRLAEPEAWKKRAASQTTIAPFIRERGPKNSMPRLKVDAAGRLWLACRSAAPIFWSPIGTVWTEYVTSYSGSEWSPAVYIHHSDNVLDNRPALATTAAGELLVIGSTDGRRNFLPMSYMPGMKTSTDAETLSDPYQNDLYMSRVTAAGASALASKPVTAAVAGLDPRDKAELATVAAMRSYRMKSGAGDLRILRGEFHRHSEISMDGGNDGSIIDQYRYMLDASYMDWVGCCDHDNGAAREYTWWISQKLTDIFHNPGKFVAMFSYERSVQYPEGHRNVVFAQRGIRPLPRLPRTNDDPVVKAPDTQMLYAYLKKFNGVVASHTSGTQMGTDWRDNDPDTEPVVEIYQGDRQNYEMPGAPRTNKDGDSIGGWRPKGFVNLALEKGYKMAFQASSDHISTHMSYANVLSADGSREALLDGIKKRHVYGATDHILAEFTSGTHMMGDAFTQSGAPSFRVKLSGTAPFAKVHVIKNSQYVYAISPNQAKVDFTWRDATPDAGKTSYYYVRGEQADGEVVWVSPMWVTVK